MDVRLSSEQLALRDSVAQVVDRLGPRAVRDLDDAERAAKLDAAVAAVGLARAPGAGGGSGSAGLRRRGGDRRRGARPRPGRCAVPRADPGRRPAAVGRCATRRHRRDGGLLEVAPGGRGRRRRRAVRQRGGRRPGGDRCAGTGARRGRPRAGRGRTGPRRSRHRPHPTRVGDRPGVSGHPVGESGQPSALRRRPVGAGPPWVWPSAAPTSWGRCVVPSTWPSGYASDRRQFGRPIGSFQAVQHLLADAHVVTEGSRSVGAVTPPGRSTPCRRVMPWPPPRWPRPTAPGRLGRCARPPSRSTAVSATPGSAWPTSSCDGPCSRSDVLGGEGANLERVLAHQGIGGGRGLR